MPGTFWTTESTMMVRNADAWGEEMMLCSSANPPVVSV